jgi:hypothetical protein
VANKKQSKRAPKANKPKLSTKDKKAKKKAKKAGEKTSN